MAKKKKEYPMIGFLNVRREPSEIESKYDALWAEFEPKVRKMAGTYRIEGVVGAELEDLVQMGQAILLHTLRHYETGRIGWQGKESAFNTFFYHCLKAQYRSLIKRCFPRQKYIIVAHNPASDEKQIIKCVGEDLEAVLMDLRSSGHKYAVLRETPDTRYGLLGATMSIETPIRRGSDGNTATLHEVIASPEEPMTVEQVIDRIKDRIPDEKLRSIALMLFEGHTMSGSDGIMRQKGMNKHQAERCMRRIRMLLAGEFGMVAEGSRDEETAG